MTSFPGPYRARVVLWTGIGLVLFKLWLVSAQTVCAIGPAAVDDRLFLTLARELLRGDWLGKYNQLTLAKGPMYSLWVAGTFLSGIPLFTAQHLLYAAMCGLLVQAMRPMVASRWVLLLVFAVVLFNPMTYEAAVHGRVLRQNIYHSCAIGTLAGLVALYSRRNAPWKSLVGWVLLAGFSFGAFWLTREEGVWFTPLAALLFAWLLLTIRRESRQRFIPRSLFLLSAPGLFLGVVGTVCALNLYYYGIYTTVEFKAAPFMDAYGALCRVTPKKWRPYIPVQREVRERIYAVSPAFAELRPYLEGSLGDAWSGPGEATYGIEPGKKEIAGGWFMWALRDAASLAGHCKSGAGAMAYYQRIADEVNAACDDGRLAAGPRRSGFLPVWNARIWPQFLQSLGKASRFFVTLDGFTVTPVRSVGPPDLLVLFSDMTRERLSPESGPNPLPQQRWLDKVRLKVLGGIGHLYVVSIVPLAVLAGFAWLVACLADIGRRRVSFWTVLNLGMICSAALLIGANALIDATSFPSVNTGAFTACYPLYLLFLFTSWFQLHSAMESGPAREQRNEA